MPTFGGVSLLKTCIVTELMDDGSLDYGRFSFTAFRTIHPTNHNVCRLCSYSDSRKTKDNDFKGRHHKLGNSNCTRNTLFSFAKHHASRC